jgi:Domain of unknown function (DUF4396)
MGWTAMVVAVLFVGEDRRRPPWALDPSGCRYCCTRNQFRQNRPRDEGRRGSATVVGMHEVHTSPDDATTELNALATRATVHCLTGCSIGEVAGMVISSALAWHDLPSVVLSIVLAFIFGYGLTVRSLRRAGIPLPRAGRLAFASDTVSIATMEVVDTATILVIPGAMAAGLVDALFWGSLAVSLAIAGIVAWPVNRWLIGRGSGHAVIHGAH